MTTNRFQYIFKPTRPVEKKPKASAKDIKAWKPSTPAGRKCKATMLKWAKLPRDGRGVFDYRYGRLCPVNDPTAIANWYKLGKEAIT